jgi:hypothetical protein
MVERGKRNAIYHLTFKSIKHPSRWKAKSTYEFVTMKETDFVESENDERDFHFKWSEKKSSEKSTEIT